MTSLAYLNAPLPKKELKIVSNSLTASTSVIDEMTSNLLTLNNVVGVPNAPLLATTFYSSGQGNLTQVDDLGGTVTYATTSFVGDYLPRDGSLPMTGDLDLDSNDIVNANNLNVLNSVAIGKSSPPVSQLEVVGTAVLSDNGGVISKQLILNGGTGTISTIQSYQQAIGVRDLNVIFKNLALGTSGSLSAGGANGAIFIENASINPSSDPVGGSILYSSSGDLNCRSSSGVITNISKSVLSDGSLSIQGNLPVYTNTSGLEVTDSGIPAQFIASSIVGLSALVNTTDGVAPEGQNSLWQLSSGLTFNGGIMKYIESVNILYSSDYAAANTNYSLDGGLTWSPVVFDVAPSVSMFISYNELGLWVAVNNNSLIDFSYTSVDGINFVSSGVLQPQNRSTNVLYSDISNLFIAGMISDATHWIHTSPDGINWTPVLTVDYTGLINYLQLAQNNTTLVLIGDSVVQPSYSLDGGITWNSGSGVSLANQAITWSDTKNEFFAIGGIGEGKARSTDGILWEDLGVQVGTATTVSLIWISFPICRYFCSLTNPSNGFYNIASTIDSHIPLSQGILDGSIIESQSYGSVIYIQQYDRFLLGLDNVGIAYSTSRPLVVKALDSSMSVYPQYGSNAVTATTVTNSITETSLLSTGTGSLIIPANSMNIGSVTKIKFCSFISNLDALSNVIIRLRGNGAQLIQFGPITGPLTNVNLIGEIELTNVDNANPLISAVFFQDSLAPVLTNSSTSLDYTLNDTFDLTAQFNVASVTNIINGNSCNMHLIKF